MLKLADIQDYIMNLAVAESDRVYIGKLDNKQEKSIGVYARNGNGVPITALGGIQNSSYDIKPVSLLVHWNKNKEEAEAAAFKLFEKLQKETRVTIGNIHIPCIRLMVPEPQDVGTDNNGVYEYVIWIDFVYQKQED